MLTKPDPLILVNRSHPLPADYVPHDLAHCRIPWDEDDPIHALKQCLVREAGESLEMLCASARKYAVHITGISGYRPYLRQKELYENSVIQTFIAPPGTSEHQTGLAIDLSTPEIDNRLCLEFEHTDAYRFLLRNGAKFGFILRFPKNKENLTGYPFESWHFRYVGRDAAAQITDAGVTLEEYISSLAKFARMK